MGHGDACQHPVVLFQGDSAAQWLAMAAMTAAEKAALERKVERLKAEDRLNSEYLRLMATLPHEVRGPQLGKPPGVSSTPLIYYIVLCIRPVTSAMGWVSRDTNMDSAPPGW